MREEFERVGGGSVLNNSPYDLAAAALCLRRAARWSPTPTGEPLADRPLLGSGHEFQMSCVAAANAELHGAICAELDAASSGCATSGGLLRLRLRHPRTRVLFCP